MQKVMLNVPYEEKDEAKKDGAKWDPKLKQWYFIAENYYIEDFERWLPEGAMDIEKALPPYYALVSETKCWKCKKSIPVISIASSGFYLPKINYTEYRPVAHPKLKYLPKCLQKISDLYPFFSRNYSKTVKGSYWSNTCSYCNSLLGDHFLYNEPKGPFFTYKKCRKFKIYDGQPLKLAGEESDLDIHFEEMEDEHPRCP